MQARILCALLALVPLAATAEAYKCKGRDGKTSFQDQPCEPGSTGAPLILSDPSPTAEAPAPQPPGRAPAAKRDKRFEGQEPKMNELKERNQQLEAENRQLEARTRAMACNTARRSLYALKQQLPAFRYDSKGNREYVEDANRQSEIAAAQQSVADHCN